MKIFDKEQLLALSKKTGNPFISIYTPTSRFSTDAYAKDKAHFRKQIKEIEKELIDDYSLSNRETERLLAPANQLLQDGNFWQHNSDMLAVFIYDGTLEHFQLPLEITEAQYFIGQKAMVLPLIPELADDGHYYLLLLNLDHIYLYEATRHVISQIDEEGLEDSFTSEELNSDEKSLQARSGGTGAVFHGQSENSDEERKKRILNFFHKLDKKVTPLINKNPLPLYLAGVDYLIPIYKQANGYSYLMDGHVGGSFNNNDILTLHSRSWDLASSYFELERLARKQSFAANQAAQKAMSHDKLGIVKAAITGAVQTLMINKNHEHLWGRYNATKHVVELTDKREGHCMIDEAATHVLSAGGKVYITDSSNMPDGNPLAAILRYPI